MDIYNGDIVSIVSSPIFDPKCFCTWSRKKILGSLIKNKKKPLINKAISGLYPPGSTIKNTCSSKCIRK